MKLTDLSKDDLIKLAADIRQDLNNVLNNDSDLIQFYQDMLTTIHEEYVRRPDYTAAAKQFGNLLKPNDVNRGAW